MKLKFDVSVDEYKIINAILNEHLAPSSQVWVFGSRAKNTARFNSDLDLAIASDKPLTQKETVMLKDAFNESRLPYKVDVVDMHNIEKSFRDIIDSQKVRFPLSRSLSGVEGKGNVPQLRFSGFSTSTGSATEWLEKRLGEVCEFQQGVQVDVDQQSKIPKENYIRFLRIENYTQKSNDFRYVPKNLAGKKFILEDEIAIVRYGATAGFISSGFSGVLANNLFKLILKKPVLDKKFILHYLRSDKVYRFFQAEMAGGAMPALSFGIVKALKLHFPSLPEQQKIADFLTEVDNKIQSLTQKKEALGQYKKGLLQKLFPASKKGGFDTPPQAALSHRASTNNRSLSAPKACIEGKGALPELRFPEFSGEWVEKRLGEVADKVNNKNIDDNLSLVLTNSATRGVISQTDYFDKDIANQENLNGYYIVDVNDFIYNPRVSVSAPVGPIKRNKLCLGVISPLYLIFRFRKNCNLTYLEQYFSTTLWHKYIYSISNIGARHDRMNIANSDFFKLPLPYPSLPEQQKIADFLTTVDNKITQVDQQIETMTQFKKGLLQQMFV